MSPRSSARPTNRLLRWLVLPLAALLALVLPAGAAQATGGSHGRPQPHPQLTVMTRNLYLGASLAPAMTIDPSAPDASAQFVAAVAQIYGTAVFTSFPTRAGAVAAEVAAARPDLIGLQEVSNWQVTKVGNPAATAPSFDFQAILLAALAARGLHYSVAGVSNNALIGPIPLVAPSAGCGVPTTAVPDCVVTFADRDVILVKDDTRGLHVGSATSGRYATQAILPAPGGGTLSFDRGWVSVPVRYQGKALRMVNTHLETEDFPAVQQAQAAELLAGPARGGQAILTGDFNSAADGSQTTSYAQLTAPRAYTDAWTVNGSDPGLSCCQSETLTNPTSQLRTRIDLILTRGPIRAISARLLGDTPFQAAPPFWASDHAGVVAKVRIR